MTLELFKVRTTIAEWQGCKDVSMRWIAFGRNHPPTWYAKAIAAHSLGDPYAKIWVDELFTADEANKLLCYLNSRHPDARHSVEKVKLPAVDPFPISAIPIGRPQGDYALSLEEGYDLPFVVEGRYDLRSHEPLPDRASDLERRKAFAQGTLLITPAGKLIHAADLEEIAPQH